eukprot:m51a1_g11931 hypothetical protein (919) ;mRNA; f:699957-707038
MEPDAPATPSRPDSRSPPPEALLLRSSSTSPVASIAAGVQAATSASGRGVVAEAGGPFLEMGGSLNALSCSPDRSLCAVGGREVLKIVRVRSGNQLEPIHNLRSKNMNLNHSGFDVAWHPQDSDVIATAATNGALIIWNLKLLRAQCQHNRGIGAKKSKGMGVDVAFTETFKRRINRLCWHPTSPNALLTGCQDGTVKLIDIRMPLSVTNPIAFPPNNGAVKDVKFSPKFPNYFVCAIEDGRVQLWDMRKNTHYMFQTQAHSRLANSLDWHPTNRDILASSGGDGFKVWDLKNWRQGMPVKAEYEMHGSSSVAAVRWRRDRADEIASCASMLDFTVHVWNVNRPNIPVASLVGHSDVVADFLWYDTDSIVSCSKDGTVRISSMAEAVHPYENTRTVALAFDPSDRVVAITERIDRKNPIPEGTTLPTTSPSRSGSAWPLGLFSSSDGSSTEAMSPPVDTTAGSPMPLLMQRTRAVRLYQLSFDPGSMSDSEVFVEVAKRSRISPSEEESIWDVCTHNAALYDAADRPQFAQLWRLVRTVLEPPAVEPDIPTLEEEKERQEREPLYLPAADIFDSAGPDEADEIEPSTSTAVVSAPHEDDLTDWIRQEVVQPLMISAASLAPVMPPPYEKSGARTGDTTPRRASDDWELGQKMLEDIISRTLVAYGEQGEVQLCALVVLVLEDRLQNLPGAPRWIISYIDLLQRMKLFTEANEVIRSCRKWVSAPQLQYGEPVCTLNQKSTIVSTGCSECRKPLGGPVLWVCNNGGHFTSRCSICKLPVRGLYVWCQGCGHGGHIEHMRKWFSTRQQCPAGCSHVSRLVASLRDFESHVLNPGVQMDTNEFYNMLFDRLENVAAPVLRDVFQGRTVTQIVRHEDPAHVSQREETFYALSLEVKNKRTIHEALGLFMRAKRSHIPVVWKN